MEDNVAWMQEWKKRHPDATWTPPERVGQNMDHVVTFTDHGEPVKVTHHDLGNICAYLKALEEATMNVPEPKRIAAK